MNFFTSESKSQTKMFISIPQATQEEVPNDVKSLNFNRTIDILSMGNPAATILLNAAPKLVEEGLELLSETINKFAQKDVTKTVVKHNVDTINNDKISIPSSITIIRGNFAPKIDYDNGVGFGDNGKHQTTLIGDKELHIELDIIASQDNESIAFQAKKYYYNGIDREEDEINELVLAVSFVPVEDSTISTTKPTFQTFLTFQNLRANTEYEFGSEEEGYDTNYQSAWMKPQIDAEAPYTLIIEIQEIRQGNTFAKLLQTVYGENEDYLKSELEAKIKLLEQELKSKDKESNE